MKRTTDLLDELAKREELATDYQLAKYLNVSTGRIANYRTGRNVADESMALRLAYELELDGGQVLLWLQIERAERAEQHEVVKALRSAARVLARAAMLAGAAMSMALLAPHQAEAAFDKTLSLTPSATRQEYTLCGIWARVLAWLTGRAA